MFLLSSLSLTLDKGQNALWFIQYPVQRLTPEHNTKRCPCINMANCGSSGATIDRAVAVLSGSSTASGKHVSTLLGHAVLGAHQTAMPSEAPSHLHDRFPTFDHPSTLVVPLSESRKYHNEYQQSVPNLDHAWTQSQHLPSMPQQPQLSFMHRQQQEHMMQMHFMIQQQHMQQQYIDKLQTMHHQSMGTDQNLVRENETNAMAPIVNDWDEALYDEIAQGATMEDMAAAWAQAEAEYDRENAAVNLASVYADQLDQFPYEFEHTSTAEAHQDVKDLMEAGLEEYKIGNIPEAIRTFETLVQMQDDHARAWYFLGKCHAENDLDTKAIACLERSVERDPFSPETLLALGVSHVNEMNYKRALQSLREWITHNPKFAGISCDDLYGSGPDESELDQVQGLLLRALDFEPSPDVHEALGIVYNVSREYEAAIACFERALSHRPRDYSLWNKLGATLANSNASEQALPAYHEALKLRPKYARAWLNMAISHSNLKNYDQAARCYLQTLSLNPSATHCWSYLRIALSCQEQWDLLPYVSAQDIKAFREHYDFVVYE